MPKPVFSGLSAIVLPYVGCSNSYSNFTLSEDMPVVFMLTSGEISLIHKFTLFIYLLKRRPDGFLNLLFYGECNFQTLFHHRLWFQDNPPYIPPMSPCYCA